MNITIGRLSQFPPYLGKEIFLYRRKIFVDHLGWKLETINGMEIDEFDRPDTIYVVSVDNHQHINGCARLLPTHRPYLLGKIFPQLMNGLPVPHSSDIWELSRFAARDFRDDIHKQAYNPNSPIVSELLRESIDYAARHGARRIITVSPIGIERMLNRLNVQAQRVANPKLVYGQKILACWIEIE